MDVRGDSVKDQHFVVTGGATGIGAEICAQLRSHGARITVLDIHKPAAEQDHYVSLDLNDMAAIDAAVSAINTPVHGLFNVAGLPPRPGQRATVLRVNFFGLRRLTLALLPQIEDGGSIVNISSRAGAAWRENIDQIKALMALTDHADIEAFCGEHSVDDTRAYLLSKEAVTVWTMVQTEALIEQGIRMNSVSPAAVSTDILDDFKEAFGERVNKMIVRMGRPAHANEVASTAIFLVTPASAWLRGIDIGVDGGMFAMSTCDALGLKRS